MTYRKYLNNLIRRISYTQKKLSIEHVIKIHNSLNSPSNDFVSVHVAGTNGKGSVCKKIEQAFLLNNYKVASLTSPHILTFKERIKINNKMIQNEDILEGMEKICFEEKKT